MLDTRDSTRYLHPADVFFKSRQAAPANFCLSVQTHHTSHQGLFPLDRSSHSIFLSDVKERSSCTGCRLTADGTEGIRAKGTCTDELASHGHGPSSAVHATLLTSLAEYPGIGHTSHAGTVGRQEKRSGRIRHLADLAEKCG